jgi:hypothetical protein
VRLQEAPMPAPNASAAPISTACAFAHSFLHSVARGYYNSANRRSHQLAFFLHLFWDVE